MHQTGRSSENMDIRRRGLVMGVIISFSSLIFLTAAAISTLPDDVCAERQCSPDGPTVRFPFVLLGKQPEYCGYNKSYNLHCDHMNRTILDLPSSSLKLVVTNIDYSSQMMEIQSLETCFAKQIREFDISTTPFQYYYFYSYQGTQYSIFNCSSSKGKGERRYDWATIDCLGNDGYKVYAIPISEEIEYLVDMLEYCRKMYDTHLVLYEILDSEFTKLNWSFPQCQSCEVRGGICKWLNLNTTTNTRIGCLGGNKHHSGILKILRTLGPAIGSLFLILAIYAIYVAYSTMEQQRKDQIWLKKFLEDYAAMKPTRYSYADIKTITNNFRDKLGEGGYGNVFKGQIANKIFVAVKMLHFSTGNGDEFINEVGTMGTIHHINVVRLLGFCADGFKRALVYEFLSNGSLDKFIFPNGQAHHTLGMHKLHDIAVGIARGIEYLHQGCEQRILHFDIKPQNILLDQNYNPKISDFGLAKLCEKGRSGVSMTAARGTMGYIAPEVFSRHFGNVSYKSDIYSFGMLLLEMVGRRKNNDATAQNVSQVYFPEWVYKRLVNGEELRIEVENDEEENQMTNKLANIGLWCIQWNPADRPSIPTVLQMLERNGKKLSLPPNPFSSPPNSSEHTRPALAAISESE